MGEDINPVVIIRAALMERDPRILEDLAHILSSWEGMLQVRDDIQYLAVDPVDHEALFNWMWHEDPEIAARVRTVVGLLHNIQLDIYVFARLAKFQSSEVPFDIVYNVSEQEFLVCIPGVPGWGISHYGGDDAEVDTLLESLKIIYAKANPGNHPTHFRQ